MLYINSFKITDVVLEQPLELLRKKGVLKMFAKFIGKHLCCYLFFDKMERLQHSCFHVNFAKYLGASFVRNTSWRPLVMFDFDDYWISHLDYPISFFIPFLTKYPKFSFLYDKSWSWIFFIAFSIDNDKNNVKVRFFTIPFYYGEFVTHQVLCECLGESGLRNHLQIT